MIRLKNISNQRQVIRLGKYEGFAVDAGGHLNAELDLARRLLAQPEVWDIWIPTVAQVAAGKRIGASRTALADLGLSLDDFELEAPLKRALAEAMQRDLADLVPAQSNGLATRRRKVSVGRAKHETGAPTLEPTETS